MQGGRPGQCTVVLGHGMWSDARVFEPMLRHLGDRVRPVVIELPGHGERAGEPPARTMDALAREYFHALPERGGPTVLAGISMGAIAALHAVLLRPEVVAGLVLFAGSAAAEPVHRRLLYRAMARVYDSVGPVDPLRRSVQWVAFGSGFDPANESGRRAIRQAEAVPKRTVAAALRLMADRPSVRRRLHEITVPAMVVVGDDDRVFPPRRSRQLARALPNAELRVVPATGHAVVVERPAESAALVDELADRLLATGP